MSTPSVTIPENAAFWSEMLFKLERPVMLSAAEFDAYWPLVSTVYTKLGGALTQQNGEVVVQKYECRLRKSKKGGRAAPPKEGARKRYNTKVRPPGLCQVRIKITRTVAAPVAVTLERLDAEEHQHDLARSREIAPSVLAIQLAAAEAAKGYAPAEVMKVLKGAGTPQGTTTPLEAIGGAHMTRQHVHNISRRLAPRSGDRVLPKTTPFRQDLDEATKLLGENGWIFEECAVVDAEGVPRWGLCFAQPARVRVLKSRGYLTQFDSTHKMNAWGHSTYSFLVRDEHGIWILGAHCVVEGESPEVLAQAMKVFRQWCDWTPHYVLTGDGAVEQLAVGRAFPSGEQEVSHILCTAHTMRSLNKRFKSDVDRPIFNSLQHALYASTRRKCIEFCAEAIFLARDEETKAHIRTCWLDTSRKWAMYARGHSPLLQQVTSTNAADVWHRQLKAGGGPRKEDASNHSIRDMILHIMQQADDRDAKARKACSDFRAKSVSNCEYPEVSLFPSPVQKLLGQEIDAVLERLAQGKETPVFDESLTCHCKFARQYLLPCRHVFHLDSETKVLTAERWQSYASLFDGRGLEVYETIPGHVSAEADVRRSPPDDVWIRKFLRLRELGDRLRQQLNAVHDVLERENAPEDRRRAIVDNWMGFVGEVVEPLVGVSPVQIVEKKGRPWELQ